MQATSSGRKERTHDRLLETALDLFERHGFEETTVAQIAQAAGVTEMTFFRHFAAKHAVLIGDPYDPVIVAAVAASPTGDPALLRTVRGIRKAWSDLPTFDEDVVRRRVRIVARTPSLWGEMRAGTAATERLIAEQLVADGADPLIAAVVSAAVLSGITAALLDWAEQDDLPLREVVGRALEALDPSNG